MKYQLITVSPQFKTSIIGTFDSLCYAEIMKNAYEQRFCPSYSTHNDVCKIIEIKDYYKSDIEKAYENAVNEYHNFIHSENYDPAVSSKLYLVCEKLYELRDFVNYRM